MSIDALKGQVLEAHVRIEEVLSGMDAVIQKLDRRNAELERRVAMLEGQLAALAQALSDVPELLEASGTDRGGIIKARS